MQACVGQPAGGGAEGGDQGVTEDHLLSTKENIQGGEKVNLQL